MITIYGTEGCNYCDMAKDYLDYRGIEYQYINVRYDTEAMKMFRENGFKTIPQVYLDKEHLGGYNELREYFKERV